MGNVIFAIFLCFTKSPVIALIYENSTKGITVIESSICVIKMKYYTYLINPSPPNEVGSVVI